MTAQPIHRSTTASTAGAAARLTEEQQLQLRSLAASFAVERMDFTPAELDVLAAYVLDEVTRDQALTQLRALNV